MTGTSQRRGTPRTATTSLAVPVHAAAPRPAAPIRSLLLPVAAAAAILLLAGGVLLYVARRRPRHAARSRARREPGRRPHSHSRPRGLRHSHGSR